MNYVLWPEIFRRSWTYFDLKKQNRGTEEICCIFHHDHVDGFECTFLSLVTTQTFPKISFYLQFAIFHSILLLLFVGLRQEIESNLSLALIFRQHIREQKNNTF